MAIPSPPAVSPIPRSNRRKYKALADRLACRINNDSPLGLIPGSVSKRDLRASSATLRALRVDVERIERMARGHEQAVPAQAAEAEIGAKLG